MSQERILVEFTTEEAEQVLAGLKDRANKTQGSQAENRGKPYKTNGLDNQRRVIQSATAEVKSKLNSSN